MSSGCQGGAHLVGRLWAMAVVRLGPKRRKVHNVEEEWFALLEELGASALRHGFIGCGISPQVAGHLLWMIDDQPTLAPHRAVNATRAALSGSSWPASTQARSR